MATATFYCPEELRVGDTISLSADESHHANKSRRLGVGSPIGLVNGRGVFASATVTEVSKVLIATIKSIEIQAVEHPRITIAVAPPKGDRQKTMVDMLVQLGVSEIVPLQCARSVAKFNDATLARWQRMAIEACKQSRRAWLPILSNVHSLEQLIEKANDSSGILFYSDAAGAIPSVGSKDVFVAIGPEGGFDESELQMFANSKVQSMALAQHILRSETAAVAAMSILGQFRN